MDDRDLIIVGRYPSLATAELVATQLEELGIPCIADRDDGDKVYPHLEVFRGARVRVPEKYAEAAIARLEELERTSAEHRREVLADTPVEDESDDKVEPPSALRETEEAERRVREAPGADESGARESSSSAVRALVLFGGAMLLLGGVVGFLFGHHGVFFPIEDMTERDSNGDGRVDSRIRFERPDRAVHEVDENFDGRFDAFLEYVGDRCISDRRDLDFDGKIDARTTYHENGQIDRTESDFNQDGKIDQTSQCRDGRLVSFEIHPDAGPVLFQEDFENGRLRRILVRNEKTGQLEVLLNFDARGRPVRPDGPTSR